MAEQLEMMHRDDNALRRDTEELEKLARLYTCPIWDLNERDLSDDEITNLYLRREAKRAVALIRCDLTYWPDRDSCPHFGESNWAGHRLSWFVWPEELGPPYRSQVQGYLRSPIRAICANCERSAVYLLGGGD